MTEFYFTLPRNPLVFWILAILAVISAWNPTKEFLFFLSRFIKNTAINGIKNSIANFVLDTDNRANFIFSNAKGHIYYDIISSRANMYAIIAMMYFMLHISVASFNLDTTILFYTPISKRPTNEGELALMVSIFFICVFSCMKLYQYVLGILVMVRIRASGEFPTPSSSSSASEAEK